MFLCWQVCSLGERWRITTEDRNDHTWHRPSRDDNLSNNDNHDCFNNDIPILWNARKCFLVCDRVFGWCCLGSCSNCYFLETRSSLFREEVFRLFMSFCYIHSNEIWRIINEIKCIFRKNYIFTSENIKLIFSLLWAVKNIRSGTTFFFLFTLMVSLMCQFMFNT